MGGRVRAYVGLGSNVGDPETSLAAAVHVLTALPGVRRRGVSRLYATAPVGVVDQPEFRNAVVCLDVPTGGDRAAAALALLVALKAVERSFGRGAGPRWGPRELDLDLLVFGREALVVDRPAEGVSRDVTKAETADGRLLRVPHVLARERLFVLAPLADLAPGLVPPGWGETVETARDRRRAIEGPEAVRAIGVWDGSVGRWRPIAGAGPAATA